MHAVLRFDEDKLAHLVVLGCDWQSPPDADIGVETQPGLRRRLCGSSSRQFRVFASSSLAKRGLTIIVHDGQVGVFPWRSLTTSRLTGSSSGRIRRADRAVRRSSVQLAGLLEDAAAGPTDGRSGPSTGDLARPVGGGRSGGTRLQLLARDPRHHRLRRTRRGYRPVPATRATAGRPAPFGLWRRPDRRALDRTDGLPSRTRRPGLLRDDRSRHGDLQCGRRNRSRGLVGHRRSTAVSFQSRTALGYELLWAGSIEWVLKLAQNALRNSPVDRRPGDPSATGADHIIDASDTPELLRAGPAAVVNLLPRPISSPCSSPRTAGAIQALVSAGAVVLVGNWICRWTSRLLLVRAASRSDLKMIHVTTSGDLALQLDGKIPPAPLSASSGSPMRRRPRGPPASVWRNAPPAA